MEENKAEYVFVRLNKDNLADLKILYKNVFNSNVSIDYLKKKFDTGFTGVRYIGFLAYAKDGTPAAYYGVFPCYIELHSKKILACQSGDTMTDPRHQGKGLFTRLARTTYELADNEGIEFVFGFPNKNSYPGFVNKLKWIHKETIHTYKIKVLTVPLAKAAKKLRTFSPLYRLCTNFILSLYKKGSVFNNSAVTNENGGVIHDNNFFSYKKYFDNHILKIKGVSVWIKIDGSMWIGDIEKCTESQFSALLKGLKRLCFMLGCTEIIFNLSPETYYDNLLSANYPFSELLPIGYLNFSSAIDLSKVKFVGGDFDTF